MNRETHCDKFLLSVGAEAVQILEDSSFIMLQSFPILHIWENTYGNFPIYLFLASLCTWYWADSLLPIYMYLKASRLANFFSVEIKSTV